MFKPCVLSWCPGFQDHANKILDKYDNQRRLDEIEMKQRRLEEEQ